MLIREAFLASVRLTDADLDAAGARLPASIKRDPASVRTQMLRRVSASRWFAHGDRSGVLRAAQRRSGCAFRLDVRQRVVVKALVSRHAGHGPSRGQALSRHIAYLGRAGAGVDASRPEFFDRHGPADRMEHATTAWAADRHHFRFIISPEHGERIAELEAYVREVMRRVAADLGEPNLAWIGVCHFDTDQPHAHVLVRGRRADGRDLVIPRDYIAYGIRGRAQEVAQELLGELSRLDAERRVWRETEAPRFTGFDRRLVQSAAGTGLVEDGLEATGAWAALLRGRLRYLEGLGLAVRVGRRYRLDAELETKLRSLQLRRDIIRTIHQQRLESGREVQEIGAARVRGRVVARGAHDELGGVRWVIVEDRDRTRHYARLGFGDDLPKLGSRIVLAGRGAGQAAQRVRPSQDRGL